MFHFLSVNGACRGFITLPVVLKTSSDGRLPADALFYVIDYIAVQRSLLPLWGRLWKFWVYVVRDCSSKFYLLFFGQCSFLLLFCLLFFLFLFEVNK